MEREKNGVNITAGSNTNRKYWSTFITFSAITTSLGLHPNISLQQKTLSTETEHLFFSRFRAVYLGFFFFAFQGISNILVACGGNLI